MDAGIVELDPLADTVRPGAKDNDALLFGHARFIEIAVAGIEVGGGRFKLTRAGIDQAKDRDDAQLLAQGADFISFATPQRTDLLVGEAVLLGIFKQVMGELSGIDQ